MTERENERRSVTPWDPFGDLPDLSRWSPFRDLLRGREGLAARPGSLVPSVDVSEDDGHYVVTAEIPGAKKEDVHVEVHEGVLTIRGEKRSEREEKKEKRHYVERSYGSFTRSFTLPQNADPDRLEARFKDGVLTVTIGKTEESKPRTVDIKS